MTFKSLVFLNIVCAGISSAADNYNGQFGKAVQTQPANGVKVEDARNAVAHPDIRETVRDINLGTNSTWDMSITLSANVSAALSGDNREVHLTTFSLEQSDKKEPQLDDKNLCIVLYQNLATETEEKQRQAGNGECQAISRECRAALLKYISNECEVRNLGVSGDPCEGQVLGGVVKLGSPKDLTPFYSFWSQPANKGSNPSVKDLELMSGKVTAIAVKAIKDSRNSEVLGESLVCMVPKKDEGKKDEEKKEDDKGDAGNDGFQVSGLRAAGASVFLTLLMTLMMSV